MRYWLIVAALAAGLVGADVLSAAPYEVTACGAAPGGVNNAWKASNTSVGFLEVIQACPPASGLVVQDASSVGLDTPTGAAAEWSFSAPAGTLVSALRASRTGFAEFDSGWVVYLRNAAGGFVESCQPGAVFHCDLGSSGFPPGASATGVDFTGLATASVAFGVSCRGATVCHNGSGGARHATVAVQGATVVLDDPSQATVTTVSGPLRDSTGWLRGAQQVSVRADDAGGGVSHVGLLADGAPAGGQVDLPCDYTRPAPCPPSTIQTVSLDTATLTDGSHVVQAAADDATRPWSGLNRGVSASWPIQVDNASPHLTGLHVDGAVRPSVAFGVSWTPQAPGAGSPIVRAQWRILRGTATVRSGAVNTQAPIRAAGLRVPGSGTWTVRVRLTDAAGNVGPEASLPIRTGALPTVSTTVVLATVVGRRLRIRIPPVSRPVAYQVRVRLITPAGRRARPVGAWTIRVTRGRTVSAPIPRVALRARRFHAEWRRVGTSRWLSAILAIPKGTIR